MRPMCGQTTPPTEALCESCLSHDNTRDQYLELIRRGSFVIVWLSCIWAMWMAQGGRWEEQLFPDMMPYSTATYPTVRPQELRTQV